jgi:hypothetical protein
VVRTEMVRIRCSCLNTARRIWKRFRKVGGKIVFPRTLTSRVPVDHNPASTT